GGGGRRRHEKAAPRQRADLMRQPDDVGWQFLMDGHRGLLPLGTCGHAGRLSDWTVAIGRPCGPLSTHRIVNVLGAGQFLGDRLDQPGIHRLDRGWEYRGDTAVTPNQIFMKVPARYL